MSTTSKKLKVTNIDPYGAPENGRFHAVDIEAINMGDAYYTCREEFAWDWLDQKEKSFAFEVKKPEQIKQILSMFTYFENKLKLSNKNRIRFVKTTNPKILGVIMSKWWAANKARREILTALLRASLLIGKTNEDKIKKCNYLDDGNPVLRKALNRFMSGYTRMTKEGLRRLGNVNGWRNCFREEEENIKYLIK